MWQNIYIFYLISYHLNYDKLIYPLFFFLSFNILQKSILARAYTELAKLLPLEYLIPTPISGISETPRSSQTLGSDAHSETLSTGSAHRQKRTKVAYDSTEIVSFAFSWAISLFVLIFDFFFIYILNLFFSNFISSCFIASSSFFC